MNNLTSTIYLVRHAETESGSAGLVAEPNGKLNEHGRKKAMHLGKHLANIKFTKAFHSTFSRTGETAKIIMEHSSHPVNLIQDARIRETDMDKYWGQGQPYAEAIVGAKKRGFANTPEDFPYRHFVIDGAEPVEDIIKRVSSFFEELFADLEKSETDAERAETVLIVGHAQVFQIFLTYMNETSKNGDFILQNWNKDMARGLHNTSYHTFTTKLVPASSKKEKVVRLLEFDKIHCSDHLAL